jgi:hypothetical protein
MALNLGTGLIETRGSVKMPKVQSIMEKVLTDLGWERTYEGKGPPEEPMDDQGTQFDLLATNEGVIGIQISESNIVRDLARLVSEQLEVPLLVFTTSGSLYNRRSVEVKCRKFGVDKGNVEELPVMATHTAEVTDVEHNELRQAENALRSRINGANDSLLAAEGTPGLKLKKVLRFRRALKKPKFSTPRLMRLMEKVEVCESFEVGREGDQIVVKLVLAERATSMSYLKPEELEELEAAISGRPEILHRRKHAEQKSAG